MHPNIMATRRAQAQERIARAADKLIKKFKLEFDVESLTPKGRDPVNIDMLRAEALADLLEVLAKKAVPDKAQA